MKSLITLLLVLGSASAAAMDVSMKCAPKAFSCYRGPNGPDCQWSEAGGFLTTTVRLNQDMNNSDMWRARYQTSVDGHMVTMDFSYDESKNRNPLFIKAYLAASNVMAESSGVNSVDIALRNNTYGRGYNCWQMRVEK